MKYKKKSLRDDGKTKIIKTILLSQAVTLTVNIFAVVSLMGKQFVDFNTKLMVIDCYLPILPAMQVR